MCTFFREPGSELARKVAALDYLLKPVSQGAIFGGDRASARTVECAAARGGASLTIQLAEGLRHAPRYEGEYSVSSPLAFYRAPNGRGIIIVGSFVADNGRALMASRGVRAFDAKTGVLVWTFQPLPENSAAGAANTWSRIVVDQPNGLVFLPTGSASPDYFGGLRPGENRDADSIVVFRAIDGD